MSFFKNNTKRIPTEVKLLTDIQNALADAPTTEEKPFLLEAEQSLRTCLESFQEYSQEG